MRIPERKCYRVRTTQDPLFRKIAKYSQATVVRTSRKNIRPCEILGKTKEKPTKTKENQGKPKNPRVPGRD